jgi:hypothetical protein
MRILHERHYRERVSGNQGRAWIVAGTTCGSFVAFGQKSCEQYRNWFEECWSVNVRCDASVCGTSRAQIEGIARASHFNFDPAISVLIEAQMRRLREYTKATSLDPSTLDVNLHGIEDLSGQSETRSLEVIDLAIQMIQLASKRGRVSESSDEVSDEAA